MLEERPPSRQGPGADVRPDLDSRTQIHDLVVTFYRDVAADDLLGPVFIEVAEVDWSEHIPKLVDFWCRVLLGNPGYDGFILGAHQDVHAAQAFEPELFERLHLLFTEAVDERWEGPFAEAAKDHARRILGVLARRLIGVGWEAAAAAGATPAGAAPATATIPVAAR